MQRITERKLLAYSAIASVAALSAAATSTAQGAIVYHAGFSSSANGDIDINTDGSRDLTVSPDGNRYYIKNVPTANSTGYAATTLTTPVDNTTFQVSALTAGTLIGPTLSFQNSNGDSNTGNYSNNLAGTPGGGMFPTDGSERFIGLRLPNNGIDVYAWVGLTLNDPATSDAYTVTGWAYETSGAPIAAGAGVPEPKGLALLAVGAAALLRRRS